VVYLKGIILSGDFTTGNGLLTTNRDMSNLEVIERQRDLPRDGKGVFIES